jgi:hypothetical protein
MPLCTSCGLEREFYEPIGLCDRCRVGVRVGLRAFDAVLEALGDERAWDFLERLRVYTASWLHGGDAARFMRATSPAVVEADGWDLGAEVAA